MEIRPAKHDEWESAMALAWRTFLHFEASDYTPQGVDSFLDFISDTTLNRMFIMGNYQLFVAVENEPKKYVGRYGGKDFLKDAQNGGTQMEVEEKIVGLISLREVNHISLLFVDEKYHKQGIGRALMNYVADYLYEEKGKIFCTVNAAPYAVEFYKKVGFHAVKQEESKDGIRYTPMVWYFKQ